MDQMVILDPSYVTKSLARQELKRWWVAEAVGVHKTTLRRWLQGSIGRIRADRVSKLAEVLGEPYERLLRSDVPQREQCRAIGCNRQYDNRNDSDSGSHGRIERDLGRVLPPIAGAN